MVFFYKKYSRTLVARHILVGKAHPGDCTGGELEVQPAQARRSEEDGRGSKAVKARLYFEIFAISVVDRKGF